MPRLRILGITGSPATGKRTVGRLVAQMLGWKFIDLNDLALRGNALIGRDQHGFVADARKLRKLTLQALQNGTVIAGHLLPSVLRHSEVDLVAILRLAPEELEKRYRRRRYSAAKTRENLAAEIIDICLAEAVQRFGAKTLELDTTGKAPHDIANEIVDALRHGARGRAGGVDWLSHLKAKGILSKYLS